MALRGSGDLAKSNIFIVTNFKLKLSIFFVHKERKIYDNRRMKHVEIVLRRGEKGGESDGGG
jgi:uncharacterized membrane protein (UPF0127 family)